MSDNVKHGIYVLNKGKLRVGNNKKVTESQVLEIRKLKKDNPGMSYPKIAKMYNITRFSISNICRNIFWRYII